MKIISRSEAKALGLTRYFTGRPCRRGHLAERGVAGGHCCDCHAGKAREWRAQNPEKVQTYNRQFYQENQEILKESSRRYRAENSDRVRDADKKRKSTDEARARKREYHRKHRVELAEKKRAAYLQNPEAHRETARRYRRRKPDVVSANRTLRRALQNRAIPRWFSELDAFVWVEAAALTKLRKECTGIDWAADHMIPVKAREACGLHLAVNCQVIPAVLNNRKHNKMLLTQPLEWLRHL